MADNDSLNPWLHRYAGRSGTSFECGGARGLGGRMALIEWRALLVDYGILGSVSGVGVRDMSAVFRLSGMEVIRVVHPLGWRREMTLCFGEFVQALCRLPIAILTPGGALPTIQISTAQNVRAHCLR